MPFDASKVERTRWVYYGHDGYAPLPEDGRSDNIAGDYPEHMKITVSAADFDACAAALGEACAEVEKLKRELVIAACECGEDDACSLWKQVEKLKGIVREYRAGGRHQGCHDLIEWQFDGKDHRCSICKRADEALEERV